MSGEIKFYFKLPNRYKIPKPMGIFKADWALVVEDEKKIYFVVETKESCTL